LFELLPRLQTAEAYNPAIAGVQRRMAV